MIDETTTLPATIEGGNRLPSPELAVKAKRAADLAKHASAERTRHAYRYQFAHFERWCREHGAPFPPTSPEVVATYLSDMHDDGVAASSLGLKRAAILWVHREAGHEFNSRAEPLRKVLAGARRTRKADPKRVRAFTVADFHELSPHLGDDLVALRDRAMLALGLARVLRGPSELCAIDLHRLGSADGRAYLESAPPAQR